MRTRINLTAHEIENKTIDEAVLIEQETNPRVTKSNFCLDAAVEKAKKVIAEHKKKDGKK